MAVRYPAPVVQIRGIELTISEKVNFEELNNAVTKNVENALKAVAAEVKEYWQEQASITLNTSKEAYIKSITTVNNGDGTFSVTLAGKGGNASKNERWLAKAREAGIPSFDMKPGLLKGSVSRVIRLPGEKFRTVSSTSSGWVHPGMPAANLRDRVEAQLKDTIFPKHVKKAIQDAINEFNSRKTK